MPKEIFQSENDEQFYFHVMGENGEIVSQSEGYTRAHDAERGYNALVDIILRDHMPSAVRMRVAMQKFVDRVDKGEIRSKRTYAEFKDILGS